MSIVPEYIIQQMLVLGINKFREESDLVRMLFRTLSQRDVDGIVQFMRDETIDIALNWPDTQMKVPAIVISLKNENEDQAFLGDVMQAPTSIQNTGTPFRKETLTAPATTIGSGSFGGPGLDVTVLEGPFQVTFGDASSVRFALVEPFNISDPIEFSEDEELLVVIREGTGAGQRRVVSTIVPRVVSDEVIVTTTSVWGTPPDTTSVIEFQMSSTRMVTGEPSKLFEDNQMIERLGALYSVSYQILIVGPNQELTIFLYALVKAIFVINREYLFRHGFIEPKLGGTDFVAKPEYLPDLAYQRSLILEFKHAFDVYLAPEIVTSLSLELSVYDPDISDNSGASRVVSTTSLDIP